MCVSAEQEGVIGVQAQLGAAGQQPLGGRFTAQRILGQAGVEGTGGEGRGEEGQGHAARGRSPWNSLDLGEGGPRPSPMRLAVARAEAEVGGKIGKAEPESPPPVNPSS